MMFLQVPRLLRWPVLETLLSARGSVANYSRLCKPRARWKQGERGEIAFLIGLLAGLSSAKLLKGR